MTTESDVAMLPDSTLIDDWESLRLQQLDNDLGILTAASLLERAVNNTSVFLVLDVAGTYLLFPGDSQQGAWEHVLEDSANREYVTQAAFYKIGHHGSRNGTPKSFVEQIWDAGGTAMLPWGLVKRWEQTIPKAELLTALAARHHQVLRADIPPAPRPSNVQIGDLWTEITFTAAS